MLLFLLLSIFLLAGCGTLHMDLKQDGSGEFHYVINENEYYTKSDIKTEIENYVDGRNDTFGDEVTKIKKVKETDRGIEAIIEVKKIFDQSGESLFATVKDIQSYDPSILEDLEAVNKDEKGPDFTKDKKLQDLAVVHIVDLDSMIETTISVPGKVVYLSGGKLDRDEKDTVKVDGYSTTIVYEPSGGGTLATTVIVVLLIVAAGAGIFLYMKKKKGKGDAAPNTGKEGGVSE